MPKLLRFLKDDVTVGAATFKTGDVALVDDTRFADLVKAGAAASMDSSVAGSDAAQAVKQFGCRVALAGATQTLNLTSLAAAGAARAGDATNFTAVHTLIIENLGTGAVTLSVGNAGSNPFDHFFTGTTPRLVIPAGTRVELRTKAAAGLTTTSKNNLMLDPGASTFDALVSVKGIGS